LSFSHLFFSFSSKRPAPLGIQDVWISRFCSSTFFFFLRFQEVLSQIFQQKKKEIQTKRKKRFFFSSILLSFLSLSIQEKWLKWMFQNSKEIVCSDF